MGTLHDTRFPNESAAYRAARDEVLRAEIALRRQTEDVAAMRRKLPLGGAVPVDYEFVDATNAPVRLSRLFTRDAPLVVYSFMYGPQMKAACPSCTSILDSLDAEAPHVTQRVNLAVVAKSPIERILAHARDRGWRNLRLLSSAQTTYNRDYHGEDAKGSQTPALNVFVRHDGAVRHAYCTELMFAKSEPGQDPRHVDAIWPLWNLFDYTPEGRGDFYPALRY
ncbi:MAG TPA: DUF899 family protein [Casimicrobiaceae bacterium]|nr:DUF899 family protein [Casimicrobiaceae bacterium]